MTEPHAVATTPSTPPLEDDAFLIGLIAEITGACESEVRRKLAREHASLGTAVREALQESGLAPHVWSDGLAAFYEQTDAFLYETLAWNRTAMKHEMRTWIADFLAAQRPDPQRVITFGDGLGIDSLFLAEAGHAVDYFEVSQRCIRFAQSLGERAGRTLSILSSPQEVEHGTYDVAVCLDVLEHVPDPPEVAALLASFLRPGGLLFVHAPFWYIHPAVSTHLKSNVRYSGEIAKLYGLHGLHPVAGQLFWNPLVLQKADPDSATLPATIGPRWQVALGGRLLKFARVFRFPHLLALGIMFRRDRRRLRELGARLKSRTEGP